MRFTCEEIEPTLDGWSVKRARVDEIDGLAYDQSKLDEVIQNDAWFDKASVYPDVNDLVQQDSEVPYKDSIEFLENDYSVEVTGERTLRIHGVYLGWDERTLKKRGKVRFTSCELRPTPHGWEKTELHNNKVTVENVDGRP